MLFNSFYFIFVFLPIILIGYFSLSKFQNKKNLKLFLILASLFFYGFWKLEYLFLILSSVLINFFISLKIIKEKKKNFYFLTAILINIFILFSFKYIDFFILNINYIFKTEINYLNITLPLAISFFSLQQIAYIVDTKQGINNNKSFVDYIYFVTFFPQLIAGPIVLFKEIRDQINKNQNFKFIYKNFNLGLFIFIIGISKKVLIADKIGVHVDIGYTNYLDINLIESWILTYSYLFQLYFDISGYADMAIGLALLFNIKLPINFNSPLKQRNLIMFWQNWHITLTRFITAYIYTPILISLKSFSFKSAMFVTLITMTIAGLWHGASWCFVMFGFLHGIGLVINHIFIKSKIKFNWLISWFITFNYINLTLIFFRSETLQQSFYVIKTMLGLNKIILPGSMENKFSFFDGNIEFGTYLYNLGTDNKYFYYLILSIIIIFFLKNTTQLQKNFKNQLSYLIVTPILFFLSIINMTESYRFIYFQF